MTVLSALVVGCGNIAGRFDALRGAFAAMPLTHAGAYAADGRFRIAACVEPDAGRRAEFMQRWSVPEGYTSIDELRSRAGRFDVVSICTPSDRHEGDITAALALGPRLVFCEKPVSPSSNATARVVRECEKAGIRLAVNYTRRWDPEVRKLQADMARRKWGPLRSAVGYYNKGLLNNGSHMLDLLAQLTGELRVVHAGKPVADHFLDDPSVPAWLETGEAVPVQIACGHAEDFALFELELVFARAVIRMEEGGLYWRERASAPSEIFAGYRTVSAGTRRPGGYRHAMRAAVDNLFGALGCGAALASTGDTALAAQRLCEQIRHP